MELNEETIKRVAELSRLELSNEEIKHYQQELQKILHAFQDLAQVPLSAELAGDARSALALNQAKNSSDNISRLQEDIENNSLSSPMFLAQAPEREGVFVRVPAILTPST